MSQPQTSTHGQAPRQQAPAPQQQTSDPTKSVMALVERSKNQIMAALPTHMSAERMVRIVFTEIRKNPELASCDQMSFIGAVIQCAQLGLEPGSGLGHAFLVPFNNRKRGIKEVSMIPGYKGLIDLSRRSDRVLAIYARLVYEKDKFELRYGDDERIDHFPSIDADRGRIIGCYSIAKIKGTSEPQREFMSRAQLESHKERFSKGNPVWETDFDEMCRKTLIRRICKYLPMSPDMVRLLDLDNRHSNGESQENWSVLDADYEPKPAQHDPEKINRIMADPGESHQSAAAVSADRKLAMEDFEKAVAGVRKVGGDPEKILGERVNDVLLKDAKTIQNRADILSEWQPQN